MTVDIAPRAPQAEEQLPAGPWRRIQYVQIIGLLYLSARAGPAALLAGASVVALGIGATLIFVPRQTGLAPAERAS